MMRAYVLIQTKAGRAAGASEIGAIKGVTSAMAVTGPYDVICVVESVDLETLKREILSQIQAVPGITRTVTCPVVHFS